MRAITDTHVHLWDVHANPWYTALKPFAEQVNTPSIYTNFLPSDYRDRAPVAVNRYVHVSATTAPRAYRAETTWVDQLADQAGLDLVMIGSVDPALPHTDLVADLEAQAEHSRFRGIRVLNGLEPDSPTATAIVNWVAAHSYVLDVVATPDTMSSWLDAVGRADGLVCAIEHTGWPLTSSPQGFAAWRAALAEAATRDHVTCKLSGLGMTLGTLDAVVLRPWIDATVDLFGANRVMFGSNMPIEQMAGSYSDWLAAVDAAVAGASDSERDHIFSATAASVYRFS